MLSTSSSRDFLISVIFSISLLIFVQIKTINNIPTINNPTAVNIVHISVIVSLKNKNKAFAYTVLSGIVEPIFSLIGIVLATKALYLMPYILCFGAGAMIYVIIDELIVNTEQVKEKRLINLSFIVGFLIMMALDICV